MRDHGEIITRPPAAEFTVPPNIADLGDHAAKRLFGFFAANIRNATIRTHRPDVSHCPP